MPQADRTAHPSVEPWLRGTRQESPATLRAVLHALDLTREDFVRWVWSLGDSAMKEQPYGLPSLGFQARHIARSLDRLLTYAEGGQLSQMQLAALAAEHESSSASDTRAEFDAALSDAEQRIIALPIHALDGTRLVGRAGLQVSLAGLLVHLADHTQRHSGQAVTTSKLLQALHGAEQS